MIQQAKRLSTRRSSSTGQRSTDFHAKYICQVHLPSLDKYIDEVEWNVPSCNSNNNNDDVIDDAEVLDGLDEASREEGEQEENNVLKSSSRFRFISKAYGLG